MNVDYDKVRSYVAEKRKDTTNCYDNNGRFITRREARAIIHKQMDPLAKYKGPDYSPYANTNGSKFARESNNQKFLKKLYKN